MQIALKIDVDTYRGIEDGASRLADFLRSKKIPASFFVSLGPDNSGWAASRAFRHRGFLKKMKRTSALSLYGFRTIFSGTLLPARPMGTSHKEQFLQWRDWGFEVSPHGYDHILWHDHAAAWDEERAAQELQKVSDVYRYVFGEAPKSFAAPGWQAGWGTWQAMEKMNLLYHSDTRGTYPYFPSPSLSVPSPLRERVGEARGEGTLEIPTTLPTWDEMFTWDGVTRQTIVDETWKLLNKDRLNVWTIHAEFEGAAYFPQFHEFVERAEENQVEWVFLPDAARKLLETPELIPSEGIQQAERPGRAGTVSCQHG